MGKQLPNLIIERGEYKNFQIVTQNFKFFTLLIESKLAVFSTITKLSPRDILKLWGELSKTEDVICELENIKLYYIKYLERHLASILTMSNLDEFRCFSIEQMEKDPIIIEVAKLQLFVRDSIQERLEKAIDLTIECYKALCENKEA